MSSFVSTLLLLAATIATSRAVHRSIAEAYNGSVESTTTKESREDQEWKIKPEVDATSLPVPISVAVIGSIALLVCCFCCLRCAIDYDTTRRSGNYAASKSTKITVIDFARHLAHNKKNTQQTKN